MHAHLTLATILALIFLPLAHAGDTKIGEGTIVVGNAQSPATNSGIQQVDGFDVDVSNLAAFTTVYTVTKNPTGSPYDIDIRWFTADGTHVEPTCGAQPCASDPCETNTLATLRTAGEVAPTDACTKPLHNPPVTILRVAPKGGVNLDVSVYAASS